MTEQTRLFNLRPDDDNFSDYFVDASHRWGLPGIDCAACGDIWLVVGLAYPEVDASMLGSPTGPLSLSAFREKVNLIGRPDLLILPATQFGPLVGEASGTFPELCWLNPWTPLISEEGLRRLSPFGLDLKCVPTQIAFPAGLRYLEPSLRALGRLADGMKCVCSVCQRQRGRMPDRLRLELDTPTPDLFRVANFPTLIVATERFVALAAEHDIRGFVACEIESIQPSR